MAGVEPSAARPTPAAARLIAEFSLPGDVNAPRAARDRLGEAMGGLMTPASLDVATLAMSEVVTNAVTHGGARTTDTIGVRLERSDDTVRISVSDPGRGDTAPRAKRPADDMCTGRGLMIVDAVSRSWGTARSEGTEVWFEVDPELS